jgi:hypothetical protein
MELGIVIGFIWRFDTTRDYSLLVSFTHSNVLRHGLLITATNDGCSSSSKFSSLHVPQPQQFSTTTPPPPVDLPAPHCTVFTWTTNKRTHPAVLLLFRHSVIPRNVQRTPLLYCWCFSSRSLATAAVYCCCRLVATDIYAATRLIL